MTKALTWVCLAMWLIACNKNSNELPPIAPVPLQDTTDAILSLIDVNNNNSEVLAARYIRKTVNGHDVITLTLTNKTGLDINNLKLQVEICRQNAENYDACNLQKVIGPMIVKSSTDTTFTLFDNDGISLKNASDSTFTLHIVGFKDNAFPFAGAYSAESGFAKFIMHDSAKTSKNYFGQAHGYVQADGQVAFLLKIDNIRYINIHGRYSPTYHFAGQMIMLPNYDIMPLKTDSVTVDSTKAFIDTTGGGLHLRFKPLEMLPDSVSFIEIHLYKN